MSHILFDELFFVKTKRLELIATPCCQRRPVACPQSRRKPPYRAGRWCSAAATRRRRACGRRGRTRAARRRPRRARRAPRRWRTTPCGRRHRSRRRRHRRGAPGTGSRSPVSAPAPPRWTAAAGGGGGGPPRAGGGVRRRAASVVVEDTGGRKKNEKRIRLSRGLR
jgi:hypothetical protein